MPYFHGYLVCSTDISHHDLLPHIPSIHLSTVNSSPHLGIAPQSLNSSSQLLPLPGNPHSCLGYVWLWQGLSVLIPFRLLQITCFTLSLKCFSSDSDSCPDLGIGPLLQFPHLPRTGPVLLTLLFSPYFLHPTKYGVVLYILFHSSSTLVHSQLVFCMHFCILGCIPDVFMERLVLHIHLILCHLVLYPSNLDTSLCFI